jgi:large subunit ribosomal protein L17
MRHRKRTLKLGRTSSHRDAMLANMVCSLITEKRIKTTLAKAKGARPFAEKMVTLGKSGTLANRRRAIAKLQQRDAVKELFDTVAPGFASRPGGYTRIIKEGTRRGDGAEMAYLEWVDHEPVIEKATES